MKLLHSLALAALIALPAAFPAGAQDDTPPPPRPDRGADAAPAAAPDEGAAAPLTKDLAGPYLAGRVAATDSGGLRLAFQRPIAAARRTTPSGIPSRRARATSPAATTSPPRSSACASW